MEFTIEKLTLMVCVFHLSLHLSKTAGNRFLKFLFPHWIPAVRTPNRHDEVDDGRSRC